MLPIVEIFCNLIKQISGPGLDYLTGLGLPLWYTGFGLEKYSDYFTGFGLILCYIRLGLENY